MSRRSARDDGWLGLRRVFRFPFSRRRMRADIDAELAFHLETRADEIAREEGIDSAQASMVAKHRFGDVTAYKRELRGIDGRTQRLALGAELLETLRREARQALRSLRRSPSFSSIVLVTLALGLGASTAIFTILDRIALRPLAYPNADRLIALGTKWPGIKAGEEYGISLFMYFRFRAASRTLDNLGIYVGEAYALPAAAGLPAERVGVVDVSSSLFSVLGVRPELGRIFTPDDERPLESSVVMLSHDLWTRRYGGDPSIVGRAIDVGQGRKVVVGILPSYAQLPDLNVDVWTPLHLNSADLPANEHVFRGIGVLKTGVTLSKASSELEALTRRMTSDYPDVYGSEFMSKTGFALFARSLHEQVVGAPIARALWMVFAAVSLVLLIAVANVASLFLTRLDGRRREIAVRVALGADSRRVAIHGVVESLLLGLGAAVLAIVLAVVLLKSLLAFAPPALPRLRDVQLDAQAVLFCCAVAIIVSVLLGLLPLTQTSLDASVLREGGRGLTNSRSRTPARRALVVSQVAISLVLLAGAGLMARSFERLRNVRPGFDADGVLTMTLALPADRYWSDAAIVGFWHALSQQVETLRGVRSTGAIASLPLANDPGCTLVGTADALPEGSQRAICVPVTTVAPGYFATMRIPVIGQEPGWADNEAAAGTMVVSQTLAKRFWPGQDAIGKTLWISKRRRIVLRVVGVASNVRADGLEKPPVEMAYFPLAAPASAGPAKFTDFDGNYLSFVVRSDSANPRTLAAAIRRIAGSIDARVPVADVRSMESIVAQSMSRLSFTLLVLAIAAVIAVILSAVGLYGVISYNVTLRRAEIGVRMALGARVQQVWRMIVGQSVALATIGIGIGLFATVFADDVIRSLLFQVSPRDPLILAGAAAILLLATLIASYLPAQRAARTSAAESLRAD